MLFVSAKVGDYWIFCKANGNDPNHHVVLDPYTYVFIHPNLKTHEANLSSHNQKLQPPQTYIHTLFLCSSFKIGVANQWSRQKESKRASTTLRGKQDIIITSTEHIPNIPFCLHGILRKSEDTGNCNKQHQRVKNLPFRAAGVAATGIKFS